jgi:NADH:ubiquinone oxidoreductase subunit C
MNIDEILETAGKLVAEWTKEAERPEPNRLDVTLTRPDDLVPSVTALRVKRLGYLSAITGIDLGAEAGEVEVLYHFCTGTAVVTLRVRTPREEASVPTLCDIIPSAEPFERELSEMFGVTVVGTPNPEHIYLPDDWPDGVYPLRKDFDPQVVSSWDG